MLIRLFDYGAAAGDASRSSPPSLNTCLRALLLPTGRAGLAPFRFEFSCPGQVDIAPLQLFVHEGPYGPKQLLLLIRQVLGNCARKKGEALVNRFIHESPQACHALFLRKCRAPLATDGRHRSFGLNEVRLVDPMARLLPPDRILNESGDLFVTGPTSQEPLQVMLPE